MYIAFRSAYTCTHVCVILYFYNTCTSTHSEDQLPLLNCDPSATSEDVPRESGRGMVVRPKDKLREDIKAAKKRRKEEKLRRQAEGKLDHRKLEAKLEKLQQKYSSSQGEREEMVLPPVTFERPAHSHGHTHAHTRHGK